MALATEGPSRCFQTLTTLLSAIDALVLGLDCVGQSFFFSCASGPCEDPMRLNSDGLGLLALATTKFCFETLSLPCLQTECCLNRDLAG